MTINSVEPLDEGYSEMHVTYKGKKYTFGLFDSSIMELFKTSNINIDVNAFKTLAILSTILYLFIIGTMRFICIKLLNKGVNVE